MVRFRMYTLHNIWNDLAVGGAHSTQEANGKCIAYIILVGIP
jgi:hypothetical protein